MRNIDLQFYLAYAELNNLMDMTFLQVWNIVAADEDIEYALQYTDCTMEEYVDEFMKQYNLIKEYNLIDEVKREMESGLNLWQAAEEWDCEYYALQSINE